MVKRKRTNKLQARMGAVVKYCGHNGVFPADIFVIDGVAAVLANGPITPDNIIRDGHIGDPTHHLLDFPVAGMWEPRRGVFVVPADQVRVL